MGIEIERRFLVSDDWSPPAGAVGVPMRQVYLTSPGVVPEVRVRQTPTGSVMTVKAPTGAGSDVMMARIEIEFAIDDDVFADLVSLPGLDSLDKVRIAVRLGGNTATVDVYAAPLVPMRVVEVEFDTVADAHAFDAPGWFGAEITGQKQWGNRALAARASWLR